MALRKFAKGDRFRDSKNEGRVGVVTRLGSRADENMYRLTIEGDGGKSYWYTESTLTTRFERIEP